MRKASWIQIISAVSLFALLFLAIVTYGGFDGWNSGSSWLSDPDARWEFFLNWVKSHRTPDLKKEAEIAKTLDNLGDNLDLLEKLGVEYGGHFRIGDTIYVGLVKPTEEHKRIVLEIMKPPSWLNIQFYEVDYPIKRLKEEADKVAQVLYRLFKDGSIESFYIDVNEVTDRIEVGIYPLRPEYVKAIKDVVSVGIPIKITETGMLYLDAKTDKIRPLMGGIEILVNFIGTLGFSAKKSSTLGFVIAGHLRDGGIDVYQPARVVSENLVGKVKLDPPGPRQSDSLWAEVFVEIGPYVYQERSIYVNYDYVVGAGGSNEGQYIHMQGRTSCGTSGYVLNTGIQLPHPKYGLLTNLVRASYSRASGDSGAPVYVVVRAPVNPDYPASLEIKGVHLGWYDFNGNGIWDVDETVYSDYLGVRDDLGVEALTL